MTADESVRAFFAAFSRRDVDAAVALVCEDMELWPEGTAERAGRTEPYRGEEGIRRYFADVEAGWDELVVEPGELRVAGDGVVVFGNVRGRAGDIVLEVPVIWVFKLRDGRLHRGRVVTTATR